MHLLRAFCHILLSLAAFETAFAFVPEARRGIQSPKHFPTLRPRDQNHGGGKFSVTGKSEDVDGTQSVSSKKETTGVNSATAKKEVNQADAIKSNGPNQEAPASADSHHSIAALDPKHDAKTTSISSKPIVSGQKNSRVNGSPNSSPATSTGFPQVKDSAACKLARRGFR